MAKLVNHRRNDDAVSPVIGVMLMIVVTVVIAAVVALFATNVVTSTEAAPVVVMDMNASQGSPDANSKLVMSTRGGDPLDLTKLKVVVSDSTGDYGLSFVGLDQKGVGDHLEIGEKLTVFTLDNIKTAASSASGGNIDEVADIIKSAFVVGNKIHVMVTFNENAVIYEKDIIVKAGTETQTAEVREVLKTSTFGNWGYNDGTPLSSEPLMITYGTTEVSLPVTNDSTFMGILFSKGLEGSKVVNDSCAVGINVDDSKLYEFQVNGKTLTSTTVLKKGDMISVVKKAQSSYSIKLDGNVEWVDDATGDPVSSPLTINEDGMYVCAMIENGGFTGVLLFVKEWSSEEEPEMTIGFELPELSTDIVTEILLNGESIVIDDDPESLDDFTLIDSNGEITLEFGDAPPIYNVTIALDPTSTGTGKFNKDSSPVEGSSFTLELREGTIVEQELNTILFVKPYGDSVIVEAVKDDESYEVVWNDTKQIPGEITENMTIPCAFNNTQKVSVTVKIAEGNGKLKLDDGTEQDGPVYLVYQKPISYNTSGDTIDFINGISTLNSVKCIPGEGYSGVSWSPSGKGTLEYKTTFNVTFTE